MRAFSIHSRVKPVFVLTVLSITVIFTIGLTACGSDPTSTATSVPLTAAAGNTTQTTSSATAVNTVNSIATVVSVASVTPVTPVTSVTTVALPGSNSTATPVPGQKGGLTMHEAYLLVDVQVKNWQKDAVYISIFNDLEKQIGMDSEGRSSEWFFQAVSNNAAKRTTWLVSTSAGNKPQVTMTGDEELTGDKLKFQIDQALPAISTLIDSNQLMKVASEHGGNKSDQPVGFRLSKPAKEGAVLSYDLIFTKGDNSTLIRVDALTGKVLDSARG